MFYHWAGKRGTGAHFVALQKTPEGFTGYNTFRNSTGPDFWGTSVDGFLRQHRYFGCVLLCIRKK